MVLEHQVLKIPASLPVEAAATVSVNPCTAFRLLKDFEDLEPGNLFYSVAGVTYLTLGDFFSKSCLFKILMQRKACCHVANAFLSRLELIWLISKLKMSKMSKNVLLPKNNKTQY